MAAIENTQYFDFYALPDDPPPDAGKHFSYYEGSKYVAEGEEKPNNYLYHTVHVEIPEYQVHKSNINQLK